MSKEVILTGLRSNAEYHLGNYLGGILPMVALQKRFADSDGYQLNMFAPDLHSFTTPVDHRNLYQQTMDNFKVFVAAGLDLDNEHTYIYRQSFIPQHSELTVILNNFAYFGELNRMTEFKDKSAAQSEQNISAGLFDYPVLMAADILIYGAHYIPVGEDQRQHLEVTRDIAQRINNKFEDEFPDGLFTVPFELKKQMEFINLDKAVRIRSLRTPEKKMSKSVEDPAGTIKLSDNPDAAAKKVMSATTDNEGTINFNFESQPGISNLLQIEALLSGREQAEVNEQWVGETSYGDLKKTVAETVRTFLTDIQERMADVDGSEVEDKLQASEARMREQAQETLTRVQRAVGLRPL